MWRSASAPSRRRSSYQARPAYKMDDDLDPSQQAAAGTVRGPVRVLAPAGSGKTKTLVNRILNLLNQGIAPERILALAFNKKARDEMQDRLERRGVQGVNVRTFHSFGYEIVREGLGWTYGGATQRKTARDMMRAAIQEHIQLPALRNQDPLDAFLAGMRQAKMELPALSTVSVEYGDKVYPLEPIFHSYVQKQMSASFVDFDDMIYMAVRLLLEKRELRRTYQSRFEYLLVDEFQDLNEAQLLLLQIIGLPENNIFAVGDDDQMIYGFRGADVKHIVEFEKRFPVASTHVLNTNYRSSRMIVRHTGWLVQHNLDRIPKDIQPRRDAQAGRFEVSGHASLLEQAKYAAAWLAEHKKQNNLNWRDYAVLYRYSAYQFPVAVMLDAMGIPHTPVSTGQLFQSAVGMDIYSYLQVILFPREAKAADFERILKRPNRYLTNQLIAQAKDWITFLRLPLLKPLRDWERKTLEDIIVRTLQLSQLAQVTRISAADFLQMLKTEFGLAEFYKEQSRLTDDLDQASDEGLLDVITALAANYKTPLEFFKFISKSMADQEGSTDNGTREGNPRAGKSQRQRGLPEHDPPRQGQGVPQRGLLQPEPVRRGPEEGFLRRRGAARGLCRRDTSEGRSAGHLCLHQAVGLPVGDRPQPGLRRTWTRRSGSAGSSSPVSSWRGPMSPWGRWRRKRKNRSLPSVRCRRHSPGNGLAGSSGCWIRSSSGAWTGRWRASRRRTGRSKRIRIRSSRPWRGRSRQWRRRAG